MSNRNNRSCCQVLAEGIVNRGFSSEHVVAFAKYREGKCFHDLNVAVTSARASATGGAEALIIAVTDAVDNTMEIDTEESFIDYSQRALLLKV